MPPGWTSCKIFGGLAEAAGANKERKRVESAGDEEEEVNKADDADGADEEQRTAYLARKAAAAAAGRGKPSQLTE